MISYYYDHMNLKTGVMMLKNYFKNINKSYQPQTSEHVFCHVVFFFSFSHF